MTDQSRCSRASRRYSFLQRSFDQSFIASGALRSTLQRFLMIWREMRAEFGGASASERGRPRHLGRFFVQGVLSSDSLFEQTTTDRRDPKARAKHSEQIFI